MSDESSPGGEIEAVMDDLLNAAPCGFLSFADDGAITLVNSTLAEMLGHDRGALVGQHVERILTIGSRIFYQTHWFPLLRLHGHAEEIFLLLRTEAGPEIGALVNAVRRERDGAVAYDCVLMRVNERRKYEDELLRAKREAERARADLEVRKAELEAANELLEAQALELELQQQQLHDQTTELEAASEQLTVANEDLRARTEEAEQANRAKSTFLAVMSHELRTPLNAIGGYVQLMEMGIHGPVTDAQREALGRVARSQSHLLRLINDVLDLSRIEAGRMEYAIEDVAVEGVVDGVTPMVEPQFASKNVSFTVDVAPGLIARGDREKVQQILINVLGNAVKFTPPGGQVGVEAVPSEEFPDRLEVRVHDTGIGIPPDDLESVFQPFRQVADEEGKHEAEGSGLGLAISRDMARGMGGDLVAHSTPGEGSTLVLTLPAVAIER